MVPAICFNNVRFTRRSMKNELKKKAISKRSWMSVCSGAVGAHLVYSEDGGVCKKGGHARKHEEYI